MDSSIVMKGSIQIWDVGVISMETMTPSAPHLSLTIGHEFGVVREMKWCPSGCYEEVGRKREGEEGGERERGEEGVEREGEEMEEERGEKEGEEEGERQEAGGEKEEAVGTRREKREGEERLPRLGLLAVATSDGYARILR